MSLTLIEPPADLSDSIATFYALDTGDAPLDGVERADLGQIRFLFAGGGALRFPDGRREPSYPVMVNGPSNSAAVYETTDPCRAFGAVLNARGWAVHMPLPAQDAADRTIDGARLFGRDVLDLHQQLGAADDAARIALMSDFLRARRRRLSPVHDRLIETVERWTQSRDPKVADLFASVALSQRQATRLVNAFFGGPPKLIARKYRAIRAALALLDGEDPQLVAAPFYDQSHMIREVRHFTGTRPGLLRAGPDPLLAQMLETDRILPDAPAADAAPDVVLDTGPDMGPERRAAQG